MKPLLWIIIKFVLKNKAQKLVFPYNLNKQGLDRNWFAVITERCLILLRGSFARHLYSTLLQCCLKDTSICLTNMERQTE